MLAFIRKPGRQTAVRRRTQRLAAIGAVLAFAGGTLLRAQTGTPLLQLQGNSNSISFGSQPVASTTAPRSIVLSNGGTAPLSFVETELKSLAG